MADFWCKHLKL